MTAPALENFLNGNINFATDDIKLALHTNVYTPDYDTDEFQDDLTNETTGTGYTAGGEVCTGEAVTVVQDGSATAWVANTGYDIGDIVRPTSANTYVYRCVTAGTSHVTTEPVDWATGIGLDNASLDGTVQWENCGTSFVKLDTADVSWTPNTTITARYAVLYVNGSDGTTDYVVGIIDFGQDESSSNGDFNVNVHADGWFQLFLN